ncbi:RNA-guided endonuclease InsQ/TnpB family protein [Deinococcus sp. KNUC1210]|uniref:RNA-guided endonuclease InsQ/TnpB family protein n=1 Tax=Deinococcus sp. KNUC1210 TaxID=2917691 RepID=UPI00351D9324
MMRAYKYRLSPSRLQERAFQHHLDLTRELYNAGLQERRDAYRKSGVSRSFYDQKRCLPEIKDARPEFEDVHAHVLQGTLETLDKAFKGFFRRVKAGSKAGYPRFKGVGWWDSFRYQECSTAMKAEDGTVLGWKWTTCGRPDPDGKRINLPKIGKVKVKMHRSLDGRPKTLVIKREGGEWYAVYTCEVEAQVLPPNDSVIGIDVGTRYLYTDSDGRHETNPKLLAASQRKLTLHAQSLARKKRGSGRRTKVKALLGKAHRKVARQRLDRSHKVANHLLAAHGTIVHEDLQPSKMVHGPHDLSRSIHDAGWTQLFDMLSLKAASAGRTVLRVDPSFTSQRCFQCGFICRENRSEEVFVCLSCGHHDHADVNAARNIRELGIDPEGYAAKSTRGRIGPAAPEDQALRSMSGDFCPPVLPAPV